MPGFFRLCLCTVVLALVHPALADPLPPSKTEALGALQNRLANEKGKQADLKKKMAATEAELETDRKKMIALGKELQTSEQTLTGLEEKIINLKSEQESLRKTLESSYGSMGDLILALQRIRRMPTETLIIRPGAPLETAQSAMLLQSILPALNTRATQLSADLTRLKTVEQSLATDQVRAVETANQLKKQKADMQAMIEKREKLFRQTRSAYDTQAETVAGIAAEAETLQQLVNQIAALAQEQKAREDKPTAKTRKASVKMPSLPGGAWQPPVSGNITLHFGERDEIGAESQGIRIATRPGALVTAPAGGIVRFVGPFRNYGNMVIIEHDRNFHSLISGLSRIDLGVGRKISAGEPVGTLPGSGADHPSRLYYELRHKGKPVDPAAKFPGLS